VLLLFIPFVDIVIWIIVMIDLAKSYGKVGGFAVGLIFLPFVFFPILGFGSAAYAGHEPDRRPPARHPRPLHRRPDMCQIRHTTVVTTSTPGEGHFGRRAVRSGSARSGTGVVALAGVALPITLGLASLTPTPTWAGSLAGAQPGARLAATATSVPDTTTTVAPTTTTTTTTTVPATTTTVPSSTTTSTRVPPTTTTTPKASTTTGPHPITTTTPSKGSGGLSSAAVALIVVAVVLVALIILLAALLRRRARRLAATTWRRTVQPALDDARLARESLLSANAISADPQMRGAVEVQVDRAARALEQTATAAPDEVAQQITGSVATALRGLAFAVEADRLLRQGAAVPTGVQLAQADEARRSRLAELDGALTRLAARVGTIAPGRHAG